MSDVGVLVSYHYYGQWSLDDLFAEYPDVPIAVDSGGFSAYTVGKPIDLDEYAAYCDRWKDRVEWYANLDAIRDPEGTRANQTVMEQRGLRPVPVVHIPAEVDVLRGYLDEGHERVALGGMVGFGARVVPWAARMLLCAREYGAKLHGFGVTSLAIMNQLPLHSVDSSAVMRPHRWSGITIWNGLEFQLLQPRPLADVYAQSDLLHSYGITPDEFIQEPNREGGPHRFDYELALALSAASWVRYAIEGPHQVERVYLVCGATKWLPIVIAVAGGASVREAAEIVKARVRAKGAAA